MSLLCQGGRLTTHITDDSPSPMSVLCVSRADGGPHGARPRHRHRPRPRRHEPREHAQGMIVSRSVGHEGGDAMRVGVWVWVCGLDPWWGVGTCSCCQPRPFLPPSTHHTTTPIPLLTFFPLHTGRRRPAPPGRGLPRHQLGVGGRQAARPLRRHPRRGGGRLDPAVRFWCLPLVVMEEGPRGWVGWIECSWCIFQCSGRRWRVFTLSRAWRAHPHGLMQAAGGAA